MQASVWISDLYDMSLLRLTSRLDGADDADADGVLVAVGRCRRPDDGLRRTIKSVAVPSWMVGSTRARVDLEQRESTSGLRATTAALC